MLENISPETTYNALLVVLTLHLLHHRLAKRHISFAEVVATAILCVPLSAPVPALALMMAHTTILLVQIVGSLWITRFSPDWKTDT